MIQWVSKSKMLLESSQHFRRCSTHGREVGGLVAEFKKIIVEKPNIKKVGFVLNALVKKAEFTIVIGLVNQMEVSSTKPNLVIYNMLMNCFIKSENGHYTFGVFGKILRLGIDGDTHTYTSLLQYVCENDNVPAARRFHDKCLGLGVIFSPVSYLPYTTALCKAEVPNFDLLDGILTGKFCSPTVKLYANVVDGLSSHKNQYFFRAWLYFHKMEQVRLKPDIVCYNALIKAYCLKNEVNNGILLFQDAIAQNLTPTIQTYGILIEQLGRMSRISEVYEFLGSMLRMGVTPNTFIFNSIIMVLVLVGDLPKSRMIFDHVASCGVGRNSHTYTLMLDGYSKEEKVDMLKEGVRIFSLIKAPNLFHFTALLDGFCRMGLMTQANAIILEMKSKGIELDAISYGCLVHGLIKINKLRDAVLVINNCLDKQLLPTPKTVDLLFTKLRKTKHFRLVTKLLEGRESCAFTFMIYQHLVICCIRGKLFEESQILINQMLSRRLVQNFANVE